MPSLSLMLHLLKAYHNCLPYQVFMSLQKADAYLTWSIRTHQIFKLSLVLGSSWKNMTFAFFFFCKNLFDMKLQSNHCFKVAQW